MMKNIKNYGESPEVVFCVILFATAAACHFLYNGYLAIIIVICAIFILLVFGEPLRTVSVSKRESRGLIQYHHTLNLRNRYFTAATLISGLLIFSDMQLGYFRLFGIAPALIILVYFYRISQENVTFDPIRKLPCYLITQSAILVFATVLFYLSNENNSYVFFGALLALLVIVGGLTQLLSMYLLPSQLTSKRATKVKLASSENGVWAGKINGKDVYVSTEDRAIVIGPPGIGKTGLLVSQVMFWIKTKRSFVCLDIKPELYGILYTMLEKQGYKVLVYNPTARAGHRYNPLADLEGTESIAELASALILSEGPQNAVFYENARDFLDAIISHLKIAGVPSLPRVRDFVIRFDTYKDSLIELAKSPDKNVVELAKSLLSAGTNERLLGTIFSVFKANLRFFRHDSIRDSLENSDFSLAELCNKEKPVALFLQFVEDHQQTTAGLLSMMVGHLLRYLIANTERDAVLLLLDEIGNAPAIAGLLQKLNTIRSRDIPTWLYWQSLEQMQKYGQKHDEGPNIIMGAADIKIVFRLNDNKSAQWISEHIGVKEVVVDSVAVSKTESYYRTQTTSQHLMVEPIIRAQELTTLSNFETVLIYKGQADKSMAAPYFALWSQFKNMKPSKIERIGKPYASPSSSSIKDIPVAEGT